MKGWKEIKERWKRHMPIFFKRVFTICSLVSGTALAANTAIVAAGATPHEWWTEMLPYLIGIPAGMAFVCKFTVNDKKGLEDEPSESNNTVLDHDNF